MVMRIVPPGLHPTVYKISRGWKWAVTYCDECLDWGYTKTKKAAIDISHKVKTRLTHEYIVRRDADIAEYRKKQKLDQDLTGTSCVQNSTSMRKSND
jgi:hypothetical protein